MIIVTLLSILKVNLDRDAAYIFSLLKLCLSTAIHTSQRLKINYFAFWILRCLYRSMDL